MKDLKSLSVSCHKEGISVCLDFVMNHCSEEHEWVKRAKNGEQEFQDRFFMFNDWGLPNEFERTVPQVFPESAPGNFTYCEEAKKGCYDYLLSVSVGFELWESYGFK